MRTQSVARTVLAAGVMAGVASAVRAAVIIDMQMTGNVRGGWSMRSDFAKFAGWTNDEETAHPREIEFLKNVMLHAPGPVVDDEVGMTFRRTVGSRGVAAAVTNPLVTSAYEPFTTDRGTVLASLGYAYYPFDHGDGEELSDRRDHPAGALALYGGYAIRSWLTVGAMLPVVTTAQSGDPAAAAGEGAGDLPIDAEVMLLRGRSSPLSLGLRGRLQLPTGDNRDGTGVGHTLGGLDLRASLPLSRTASVRAYGSFGGETDFSDEVEIGAWNYALGVIWNGLGARTQGWSAWAALAGSHFTHDRSEPGTESFDDLQNLRVGGAYLFDRLAGGPSNRQTIALDVQVPTVRDGIWSSWSYQASYGVSFSRP